MEKLTGKQEAILQFIEDCIHQKGYPPTVREIANEFGVKSSSTAHGYLSALEHKGYIKRYSSSPRAIELIHPHQKQLVIKDLPQQELNTLFMRLASAGYAVEIK